MKMRTDKSNKQKANSDKKGGTSDSITSSAVVGFALTFISINKTRFYRFPFKN